MKALKAVTKLALLPDNDHQDEAEFWMEDEGDCDISVEQPSFEIGRRKSDINAIVNHSYLNDEPCAGRFQNPLAILSIKRAYISEQLRKRKKLFASYKPITVFCGTFNVNGRKEPGADISSWLYCKESPDIYAIGLSLNLFNRAF